MELLKKYPMLLFHFLKYRRMVLGALKTFALIKLTGHMHSKFSGAYLPDEAEIFTWLCFRHS